MSNGAEAVGSIKTILPRSFVVMQEIAVLCSLAAVFFVLIASPGPNFLVITQIAINESRLHAICTGLGVASGSVLWASAAAAGLGLVFARWPLTQPVLQLLGGAYLVHVGLKIWRNAHQPLGQKKVDKSAYQSLFKAYRFGLATNLTNPKALVFYTSVFTSLLIPGLAPWTKPAAIALIAVLASSWFVTLATLFSVNRVQHVYRLAKTRIDQITAACLTVFGVKLIWGLVSMLPIHLHA
ncbi:LysE family translocator [Burkholderia singularis]|nr:LysE family transporter [Burkholderia singularis]